MTPARNKRARTAAARAALAAAFCLTLPRAAAAQDVEALRAGKGQPVPAAVPTATAAASQMRSGPAACLDTSHSPTAALRAPADASVADFARLLHGTWVRRLTIGGAAVETNSFLYFDMFSPAAGRGQALMIDRINQGWDERASRAGAAVSTRSADESASSAPETHPPATTGAYWSVVISPAPADAASRGRKGVLLALVGDYRGTGEEYPAAGFRFTETGTFYRDRTRYATLHPWQAPPMAVGDVEAAPSTDPAEPFTPVDAVVLERGGADAPGASPAAAGRTRKGFRGTKPPTLTYIICKDEIVDRYDKISSLTPTVEGKSLRAAWDWALASGMFHAVPAR